MKLNNELALACIKDFRVYLKYAWSNLNIPCPTPVQYDIADFLQSENKRKVILAFRGVGKTWETAAYATWRLLRQPNTKILIVSGSGNKSNEIANFIYKMIYEFEILQHLRPNLTKNNNDSAIKFDVTGCNIEVAPSLKSLGISSQLAGSRADLVIADDVENITNSGTEDQRAKIEHACGEFESILKPGENSEIVYLGTPQTQESLYTKLADKGFVVRIWTARYPENIDVYNGMLAPMIVDNINGMVNEIVDTRFTRQDLIEREASIGRSSFRLQFMLDTSMSDANRFPLRTYDMITYNTRVEEGPSFISWSSDLNNHILEFANLGFNGDKFFRPMEVSNQLVKWEDCVMSIDPSGRGSDETGYSIVKQLMGKLFVVEVGGVLGGYSNETLKKLSIIAKKHSINTIVIESNFGDSMWAELFKPILYKIHRCQIDEFRAKGQKEIRLIETIEPLLNQHKLIFDYELIKNDIIMARENPQNLQYSLIHQLTHLSSDRNSLKHDDKVDALSIALNYFKERMSIDEDKIQEDFNKIEYNTWLDKAFGINTINVGSSVIDNIFKR